MADPTAPPTFNEFGEVEPDGSAGEPDLSKKKILDRKEVDPAGRAGALTHGARPVVIAPPSTSVPAWMVLLAGVCAVIVSLGIGYFALRASGPTATSTAPPATAPAPTTPPASTTISPPAAACAGPLGDAQALSQARRWMDAAARLEPVRAQCDVVGPLYDAYLNQARSLADDERGADAITFFDKAIQVKSGTEATNERALAVAYQDGRAALGRQDWNTAITNLTKVQSANPGYARGNNSLNLINAYLAAGDQLVSQNKCGDALTFFQRADTLKPNEGAITQRVNSAKACAVPTAPPPAAPTATLLPPPTPQVEPTVRAYYDAINNKRWSDAYAILSKSAQGAQSLSSFTSRFDTNRGIGVRFIDGVSIQGSMARLNAHTQTVTQERTGLVTTCTRVSWVMILDNGQWKRDVASETANEFKETC